MRKNRTPYRTRRTLCGVPADNHEVYPGLYGVWRCTAEGCDLYSTPQYATGHVVAHQFTAERSP